ncbi:hypothetical protein OIE68_04140 [Nocardia vinacea]|uniref:hypothetical protein n=1 Tax=Nocardia vinacea TaxID=96468 RepID=UPI002E0FC448|nr:hypothetical protein OIE68_04140 [Nocardia vinacea]
MTPDFLTPVLPGKAERSAPHGDGQHRPVTELFRAASVPKLQWRCGIRRVDVNGRVLVQDVLSHVGWTPHTALAWSICSDMLVVGPGAGAGLRIGAGGALRVPARARRRIDVRAGDNVLIAAHPQAGILLVLAPALVEQMLHRACGAVVAEVSAR